MKHDTSIVSRVLNEDRLSALLVDVLTPRRMSAFELPLVTQRLAESPRSRAAS